MGIFSFLTGSREPVANAEASRPAEALAAEPGAGMADVEPLAAGRAEAGGHGEPDVPGPAPDEGFWNYGALTELPSEAPGPRLDVGPMDPQKTLELKPKIVDALSTIFDPEIPVNIYELGLIYEVVVDASACVQVRMTLTSPACPSAQQLPSEVLYKVKAVPGVADAAVDVVWEPPWTKDMMSDAAKLSLGIW